MVIFIAAFISIFSNNIITRESIPRSLEGETPPRLDSRKAASCKHHPLPLSAFHLIIWVTDRGWRGGGGVEIIAEMLRYDVLCTLRRHFDASHRHFMPKRGRRQGVFKPWRERWALTTTVLHTQISRGDYVHLAQGGRSIDFRENKNTGQWCPQLLFSPPPSHDLLHTTA